MEPADRLAISVITLGVSDIDHAVDFYRTVLGRAPRRDRSGVAYFALAGSWLALYPREDLAAYAGVGAAGGGFRGVTLACNVADAGAVDALVARAGSAGARIVRPPGPVAWGGYTGWFADPDGHLWEAVWNPRWPHPGAQEPRPDRRDEDAT